MENTINSGKTSSKKMTAIKIIVVVFAAILIFLGVFFLYDSPAEYVVTQDNKVYLDKDGEPYLYYKDLFGKTFTVENGKRAYHAVPVLIDTRPQRSPVTENKTTTVNQ